MLWLVIYISIVGLFVKTSWACYCCEYDDNNLLNELNHRINKVNELIQIIQKKDNKNIIENNYDYDPTIERANLALDQSKKIQNQLTTKILKFKNQSSEEKESLPKLSWQQQQQETTNIPIITRRNMKNKEENGEWNKQFYAALSKVLQKELAGQPGINENLGDNLNILKYIGKA